jgi:hypothetical protein
MFLAHARTVSTHSLTVWLLGYFLITQWKGDCGILLNTYVSLFPIIIIIIITDMKVMTLQIWLGTKL